MLINKTQHARKNIERLPCLPLDAAKVEFIYSPADFRVQLIQLIQNAKTRIYITALYWQNDEAGQSILDEIYRAKQRDPALDIKILVDWHRAQRNLLGAETSATNADWYCEQRRRHQAEGIFFGVPINTREIFGVLHIKGFVFDDTVLYSGASINNVYLNQQDKYRYDRYHKITDGRLADSLVDFINDYLSDPAVVNALDEVSRPATKELRNQIRTFRRQLAATAQYRPKSALGFGQNLTVTPLFGLNGNGNMLNRTIEDLFLLVKKSLVICTPYFNLPRSLQKRIQYLLAQNKKVEIIVGDKVANDFYIPPDQPFKIAGALPYLYEKNLRAFSRKFAMEIGRGLLTVRTWKDGDNTYHLKGVWADEDYILLTGNNLNPRAWRLDAENGLFIHDPKHQLRPQVLTELEHIRRHTKVLKHYGELEEMRDYPESVQKLLRRFARVKADRIVKMIL